MAKVKCPECKESFNTRGLPPHRRFKHNVASSPKRPVASVTSIEDWKRGFVEGYDAGQRKNVA